MLLSFGFLSLSSFLWCLGKEREMRVIGVIRHYNILNVCVASRYKYIYKDLFLAGSPSLFGKRKNASHQLYFVWISATILCIYV